MGYLKNLWYKFTSLLDYAASYFECRKLEVKQKTHLLYRQYALKRSIRHTGLPPQWLMAEAEFSTWDPKHQVILHKLAGAVYPHSMVAALAVQFDCTNERIRQIAIHKCWKYVNGKGCPFKFQKQYNRKVGRT